jgi:hypothetical protein
MLQAGDILAFYGTDPLSLLIRASTFGPSHVGILAPLPGKSTDLLLFESTTLSPLRCASSGEFFDGVQCCNPLDRISSYHGKVYAYHLHPDLVLSPSEIVRLSTYLQSQLGRPYDYRSAVLSITHLLKFRNSFTPDSIFCSALVARSLMLVNRMNWANPEWFSPASLLSTLRTSATYGKVQRLN